MNGKQIIAKLKAAGWTLARIEGSHHIFENQELSARFPFLYMEAETSARAYWLKYSAKQELT